MQQCVVCGEAKPPDAYYARQRRCKACCTAAQRAKREAVANDPAKAEAARLYRLEYKRAKRRAEGKTPRAEITQRTQKKAALRAICKSLASLSKQRQPKETSAELFRRRYRDEPAFRAKQLMRASMRKSASKYSWVAVYLGHYARKNTKRSALWNVVGYTAEELVAHISRQFTKGMTMQHFMRGEIHIDHIIPKSIFDMQTIEDVRACHALSNLRPMWAADNLKKSAHVQSLL